MNFGDAVSISGCSVKSRHLELSCGCSAVDSLFGGGVPNTSFVVFDEVGSRTYSDVLLRLSASEGLYEGHDILSIRSPFDEGDILDRLPSRIDPNEKHSTSKVIDQQGDSMQIAWRYAPMKEIDSSISKKISKYDLATTVSDQIRSSSTSIITRFPSSVDQSFSYQSLFNTLSELLKKPEYAKSKGPRVPNGPKPRLLRVIIKGLGSPLWEDDESLKSFIVRLPHLLRNAYVVVFASMNSSVMRPEVIRQLETTADGYFRMEAMNEEEKKMHDKAHGYFRIIRLPRLISLSPPAPPSIDLTFDLHRRSFDIRILHLPPALGDDDEETKSKSMGSCSIAQQF